MQSPIRTKTDLLEALNRHRSRIRALGVKRLAVFGSFARDAAGSESYVDLLVEFLPGEKTFDHFMGLAHALEEVLGRRVDLVTAEALSPYIGPRILAGIEYVPLAA